MSAFLEFIEPPPSLPEPERRRSRLLAWLFITLLPLLAVMFPVIWFSHSPSTQERGMYSILLGCLVAGLLFAFAMNRRGHYSLAAGITVAVAVVGPWGSMALDPSVLNGNYLPLIYSILSVFLCSMLLSGTATTILALIQFTALVLVSLFAHDTPFVSWPSLLFFVFFSFVLSVVSSVIARQDMNQIEAQSRQLADSQVQLRELSIQDALTGLFNRRYLDEQLEIELARATRGAYPVSILMVDIDHFKTLNDRYGHLAGDIALRGVGSFLQTHIRGTDIACRYGGEEFLLILPNTRRDVAWLRAQGLRQDVKTFQILPGEPSATITISIGVAVFPEHGASMDAIIGSADTALYCAKQAGRDCVVTSGSTHFH